MRASRWEVLGAWLRIWTPPRDGEIPPCPLRRALVGAVVVGGASLALALLVVAPAIDESKTREATRERTALAAFERAERTRLTRDQRPRSARAAAAARLFAAGRSGAARASLLADVRANVLRDARARAAAGTFERPAREVRCSYIDGDRPPRVRLECLAVTSSNARVAVGQPFLVAGSLRDGRYTWCHENPGPGEGAAGVGVQVALSPACLGG